MYPFTCIEHFQSDWLEQKDTSRSMWPIAKNGRIQFQSRKFWISLSKNCIVHWSEKKRKIRLLRNLFSSSAVCGELFLEVPYSTKTAILKHSFVLSWLLQGTMCAHLHKSSVAFELENENGHCESLDTVLWRVRAKALKRGSESSSRYALPPL